MRDFQSVWPTIQPLQGELCPRKWRGVRFVFFAISYLLCLQCFGQWTEPVLLPPPINVNPPGEYYYSTISADGFVLCLTINTSQGFGDDDVYFSERIGDSAWTVPVNAGPNVNNGQRNLSPSITSDWQTLYYVTYTGSYDIYVSHRTGPRWDEWSPAVPLPSPVNRGREFTAQISFDDSTLVFTSTGQPGPLFGGDAMYSSRLQPDCTWTEPQAIAAHLNQINGSYGTCLTDSGNTLVYGMFGGPNWRDDIYYAFRNDTGFGFAQRCDSTVNTRFWDSSPSCPADGSLLYFDSRRNEGQFDGPAHLYFARRSTTGIAPRRLESRKASLLVYPTIGSPETTFRISLPTSLGTRSIQLYNIAGQLVTIMPVANSQQTVFLSKGSGYETQSLSAGVYFVVAVGVQQEALAKLVLLP